MSALRSEGNLGNMAKRSVPADVAGHERAWCGTMDSSIKRTMSVACQFLHARNLGLFFLGMIVATAASARGDIEYEVNTRPSDDVEVMGAVPNDVVISLTATWQTTANIDACTNYIPSPVNLRSPKLATFPIKELRDGDRLIWKVWRDYLSNGECGWRLAAIDVKADRSSPDLTTNWEMKVADNRIASVCLHECPENSARVNDDDSRPVVAYCKFSLLRTAGGSGIWNPCFFDSDGKTGSGLVPVSKAQHILRPDQHIIHFSLFDLEH